MLTDMFLGQNSWASQMNMSTGSVMQTLIQLLQNLHFQRQCLYLGTRHNRKCLHAFNNYLQVQPQHHRKCVQMLSMERQKSIKMSSTHQENSHNFIFMCLICPLAIASMSQLVVLELFRAPREQQALQKGLLIASQYRPIYHCPQILTLTAEIERRPGLTCLKPDVVDFKSISFLLQLLQSQAKLNKMPLPSFITASTTFYNFFLQHWEEI